MKLRYRIEGRGWYIPQFQNKKEEWIDICVKHVLKNSQLEDVAYQLGEYQAWEGRLYHFKPNKGESKEDMQIIFKNEIKCAAFLGAFKLYYSERTKEINI
jgi:hypothetical protein